MGLIEQVLADLDAARAAAPLDPTLKGKPAEQQLQPVFEAVQLDAAAWMAEARPRVAMLVGLWQTRGTVPPGTREQWERLARTFEQSPEAMMTLGGQLYGNGLAVWVDGVMAGAGYARREPTITTTEDP